MATFLFARPGASQEAEIVRGRLLGPLDVPIANALVTITGAATQAVRTTRTDSNGVYAALFATGERDYTVAVRALGYVPQTLRVSRTAEAAILVVDARLEFVRLRLGPLELDTVRIAAERQAPPPLPPRTDGRSAGAQERDATRGRLFTLDASDLVAIAVSLPGVLAVTDASGDTTGFSVLGAPPEQNNTIVDGSTFGGRSLPRDAVANVRLATTTFDPGRGGFSGGQISATTRSGTDVFQGNARATAAEPQLSWADPASPSAVPSLRTMSGSIGGPIRRRKAHYFAATELHISSTELFSLMAPRPVDLKQYGLAADSILAVRSALGALGVPLTTPDVPRSRGDERGSAFLRLDFTPSATTSVTVRMDGNINRRNGQGISSVTFPSLASRNQTARFGLQLSGSAYVRGFLDEMQSYVERSNTVVAPYVELPTGVVRVTARYEDGREGLTPLRFGGPLLQTETEMSRWETRNELSWLADGTKHRIKLGQSLTLERTALSEETGRFGTFTYTSLDDLAANKPASYVRRFSSRSRTSGSAIAALWGGDEWRATGSLRLQYGARVDMIRPTNAPTYNPEVDSIFGVRTDRVPTDIGISPRFGFAWTAGEKAPARLKNVNVMGGVGAFRGVIPPSRVAGLFDATGLATTAQHLECVGDATPIPDWSSSATAVPASCRDGVAPVEYSTAQPNVAVFDGGFAAPVSWRASLNVERLRVRGWNVGANGTYSLGVNGESAVDLNLRRTPMFLLPAEGGRPVFVAPAAIVPATGAVAPGAPRLSDRYVRVRSYLSDLRTHALQLGVSVAPQRPVLGRYPMNASYTFSRQRSQSRGFGGAAGAFPFEKEWARGAQPAHQMQVNGSATVRWLTAALRLNLTSGMMYTPIVAGDVNGDGAFGDRAFVFQPDLLVDTTLAAQMQSLLSSAPARARACLRSQMGRIASRNSCETGWQFRPDLNLSLTPRTQLGFGDDLRLSATLINASGAVFRLLGLSSQPLARVGAQAPPNPTLLYVTGFDSSARRFQYRVNQQFGEQQDVRAGARRFSAPFQVQIGAEYRFGGPPRNAMVRSLGLVAPRDGAPLTVEQVIVRLRRFVNNPVTLVLERRDSLGLSEEQVAALEAASAEFVAQGDSALRPVAQFVLSRGTRLTDAELQRRLTQVQRTVRPLAAAALDVVRRTLREDQLTALPPVYRRSSP